MRIKFGEWETTTPENSEEVIKKQVLVLIETSWNVKIINNLFHNFSSPY